MDLFAKEDYHEDGEAAALDVLALLQRLRPPPTKLLISIPDFVEDGLVAGLILVPVLRTLEVVGGRLNYVMEALIFGTGDTPRICAVLERFICNRMDPEDGDMAILADKIIWRLVGCPNRLALYGALAY